MNVKELNEKLPLVAAYELLPGARYLLIMEPTSAPRSAILGTLKWLKENGIQAVVLTAQRSEAIRMFDLESK